MKILNLTIVLILCCLLFSCISKTEKKQPEIIYNDAHNYKFDDDEIIKRNKKDIKKKTPNHNDKSKEVSINK